MSEICLKYAEKSLFLQVQSSLEAVTLTTSRLCFDICSDLPPDGRDSLAPVSRWFVILETRTRRGLTAVVAVCVVEVCAVEVCVVEVWVVEVWVVEVCIGGVLSDLVSLPGCLCSICTGFCST